MREISGQARWWKREVDETSQRQTLTWDQRSSTCGSSLCSHSMRNVRRRHKANRLALLTGIWDAVMVNSVSWQVQRATHQLRLNRLTSTASHQAFIRRITSPICPHCGTGEETAEHLLLFCPKWAAECQQYFGDSIDITDVFQDSDNLVEFLICSGHLPP